jgi:hypothetical protein
MVGNKDCSDGKCYIGPMNGGHAPESGEDDDLFSSLMATAAAPEKPVAKAMTPAKDLVPKKVLISERNLTLGKMIGPVARNLDNRDLEVGGFFLTQKGDPAFSLLDFIIPKGLPVSPGNIFIAEHYPQAGDEVRDLNQANGTDYRMVSMFHVHPFGGPNRGLYHSGADDDSLVKLVNKMAKTTRQIHHVPYRLQEQIQREHGDEATLLRGNELNEVLIKLVYPDDQTFYTILRDFGLKVDPKKVSKRELLARLLDHIGHEAEEPRTVNFALSLVFNNLGDMPYVKMGIEEKFILTGKTNYTTTDRLRIEVINQGIDLPTEEEVSALVKERVVFPYRPTVTTVVGAAVKGVKKAFGRGKGSRDGAWPTVSTSTYGTTTYGGYSTSIVPQVVEKVDEGYSLEEITRAFVLAAYSYVNQYRHTQCQYSQYFKEVLDQIDDTQYQGRKPLAVGLREAILLGPALYEDNPKETEVPTFDPYRISAISRGIKKELDVRRDEELIGFMIEFIGSNTKGRNKAIADYVGSIEDKIRKGATPAGTSSTLIQPIFPGPSAATPTAYGTRDEDDLFASVTGASTEPKPEV